MTTSHKFSRIFRPDKIHPPRGFVRPKLPTEQSICLEIGAGKGKHAITYAQNHPREVLYAIERTKDKYAAFARALAHQHIPNLTAIHADAVAWAVYALPPASLAGVFILYPNPEPSNANQRWLNMPFFEFLLSRVQAGGFLRLASNISSYVDEAYEQASNVWQLQATVHDVPRTSQRTHFEVKYLVRGEHCQQLDMIKPAGYRTRFDAWQPSLKKPNKPCD